MSPRETLTESTSTQQNQQESGRRFVGKVALVTGSSDRGIGGAVAERLGREGASLWLVSRSEPQRLRRRLVRLEAPEGWSACDVTRPEDVDRAVEQCIKQYGKIDVLVNNAGVEVARPFEEFTEDLWRQLLEVNLSGALRVTHTALPHMSEAGGAIVNVASSLAMAGCASFSVYSATKAGMIGWTQSLALELAPRGIRVVAVAPAMVHTPMIHKHIEHLTKEVWQQIQACHPLGMGSPHDVAAAVAFLASSDARWITGISLPLGWVNTLPLPHQQFMSSGE